GTSTASASAARPIVRGRRFRSSRTPTTPSKAPSATSHQGPMAGTAAVARLQISCPQLCPHMTDLLVPPAGPAVTKRAGAQQGNFLLGQPAGDDRRGRGYVVARPRVIRILPERTSSTI